ncbi:MAG TPA: M23 family metallopeptidase [Vicinamibacterales bacterium]|nr:M23 family metallopeptidase [Vicinamibacterales bacterium]
MIPDTVAPVGDATFLQTFNGGQDRYQISTRFREDGHTGIDVANGRGGGEVRAIAAGRVVRKQESTDKTGWGYMVRIEHLLPSGLRIYSQYAHMEVGSLLVDEEDWVFAGQPIGEVGNTGRVSGVTGLHLHFEVKIINSDGCGYLPSSLCSSDTFANYLDPSVFLGTTPRLRIDSVEPLPVVSEEEQQLTVRGVGLRPSLRALVTLPDRTTVTVGATAITINSASDALVRVRLLDEGTYALRFEDPNGGQSNLVSVRVHPSIHASGRLFVDVFDGDDVMRVTVNESLVGTVNYFGKETFELSSYLRVGLPNVVGLELVNGVDGGWTYGFDIRGGSPAVHRACGTIGTLGCDSNNLTRGIVFRDTYSIVWGGVAGISTPTPHFTMSSGGLTTTDNVPLQLQADPSGPVSVTFADTSDPGQGVPILGRHWMIDGVGEIPYQASITHAFAAGSTTLVTLRIDIPGGSPSTSGTVVVQQPLATEPPVLSGLRNTGLSPEGSVDNHWTLHSGPTCPTGSCQVLSAPNAGNDAVSKWIRPIGGTPAVDPAGQYVFRLTFSLTDVEAQTAIITGRWATDDTGTDVLINGVSTGQRTTQTFIYSPFVVGGGFRPGLNTLDFVVANQDCASCPLNPVALRVEVVGRAISTASLPTLTQLPNTGTGGSGQPEPYYALVSGPTCPVGVCQPYASSGDAVSSFILPVNATTHLGGQYIYRLGFVVSEAEAAVARVSGRWIVDDVGVDILLNGVSTGFHTEQFGTFSQFIIASGFRPGVNTLDFVTENQNCGACVGNPTALRVELRGGPRVGALPTLFHQNSTPGVIFGQAVVDSTGALYVVRQMFGVSCGFGFCGSALQKIVPGNPTAGWIAQAEGDVLAPRRLALGPADRVYFQAVRNKLFAFESNGQMSIGWPITFNDDSNSWFNSNTMIDMPTGQVFGGLNTFGACFNSCFQYFTAVTASGQPLWSAKGLSLGNLFLGPERAIYRVGPALFERFDRETGGGATPGVDPVPVCQAVLSGEPFRGAVVHDNSAVFTSSGQVLTSHTPDCGSHIVFTNPDVSRQNLAPMTVLADTVVASDTAAGQPPTGLNNDLLGIRLNGDHWRNTQVSPNWDVGSPVRGIYGNIVYLFGFDRDEFGIAKLFGVDVQLGAVVKAIDTIGVCSQPSSCGVAVGPDGAVYIHDLNSPPRIFKVQ